MRSSKASHLSLAVAALLVSAACPPSEADCARCGPRDVCVLEYRYCDSTVPIDVRCVTVPPLCADPARVCAPTPQECVVTVFPGPVRRSCSADGGTVVVATCD